MISGSKHSIESKFKMALAKKDKPTGRSPMKGVKHTAEAKLKISMSNRGKTRSEEARIRYRESKLGEKNPQFGRPSWNAGFKGYLAGQQHYRWNGGRRLHYPYVEVTNPGDGYCYAYEHRVIAERLLKRLLEPTEIIHHINGNPSDNRRENLYLFNSAGEHNKHHALGNRPLISNLIGGD